MPHFAKIFDELVTVQLSSFLETNNLLSPFQSGFRRGFSTQSALLRITEDIRFAVETGLVTDLLLFDFRKAFDSIDHSVLLKRMRQLNFSDDVIRWFHSYLSGRSQSIVDLAGNPTEFLKLSSGVPQSSNPGPIAFLISMNSIVQALIHRGDSCMLFADDFQIYLYSRRNDSPQCIPQLNEDANCVARCADENGI